MKTLLLSLNALTGIDGFQSSMTTPYQRWTLGLNALTGIDGFQRLAPVIPGSLFHQSLNALTGIDGFQSVGYGGEWGNLQTVLMP